MIVNLLAAGGIAYAPVAVMLWGLLALGQNLRDDRPSGARRAMGGRGLAFVPAAVLAALMGTFLGTAVPFWKADAAIARAEAAQQGPTADVQQAVDFYRQAIVADPLSARGWIGWARLEFTSWQKNPTGPFTFTWLAIDSKLKHALKPPLNGRSLLVYSLRAGMARAFLEGPPLSPMESSRVRSDRLNSCLASCALYPTNANLRADLADALAEVGRFDEAVEQGRRARLLDNEMSHLDKKMLPDLRVRLNANMPRWRARADQDRPKT